jgi:hypothetical protein
MICLLAGCIADVSHDNPLDPDSRAFSNNGTISGNVLSYYLPYSGVAGALVTAQPSGAGVLTNSAGAFTLINVPGGSARIVASRTGSMTDSVDVNVVVGVETKVDLHLDALPVVGACQVVTRKIDQWWPHAVYSAVVSAAATDPDGSGDIAGATLQIDTIKFAMAYAPDIQLYQVTIDAVSLPQGSIEWLIGKSLTITARDRLGATSAGKAFTVTRVIQDAALPLSPTALDTAPASPQMFWSQVTLQFTYTYKLELFRLDQGVPTLLWSAANLSPFLSSFQYPGQLVTGTYYWTISVVDEFGNLSRSKEASFVVNGQ